MVFRYNIAAIYTKSGKSVPAFGYITQADLYKWLESTHPWPLARYWTALRKITSCVLPQSGRGRRSMAFIRPKLAWVARLMHSANRDEVITILCCRYAIRAIPWACWLIVVKTSIWGFDNFCPAWIHMRAEIGCFSWKLGSRSNGRRTPSSEPTCYNFMSALSPLFRFCCGISRASWEYIIF